MSSARSRRSASRLRAARSHPRRPSLFAAGVGAGAALTLRALAPRLLLLKLQRDVRALNAGDVQPRFDDHALDPSGEEIYSNRTLLLARTRWGRIVLHEDFYEDTQRILALERRLSEQGLGPSR